jgi:1-acyl-sn-glycerol-3-phosphate acyltransferase
MKLKTINKSYDEVVAMPKPKHRKPIRPNMFFRTLLRVVSIPDLAVTDFTCKRIGMEKLGKKEPCLYLMNHCSFIDLEIAATILYPRPFNIICTSDGFVGKDWLMHAIGCIPTNKFTSDLHLLRDMSHAVKKLGNSVLMYPEASYSFDGTSTPLPETLGGCLKLLGVPVVMIRTFGSFSRNPLYNNLKRRKVQVTAEMEYILSPEDIKEKTPQELNEILRKNFTFDYWRWQKENGVKITEDFRAEGLNRVLYKCPHCLKEGAISSSGTAIVCEACGKAYELTEDGTLEAKDGESAFTHIPDWYAWERECVRNEILEDRYSLKVPVDICMLMDTKHVYRVGEGELTHTKDGFHLVGCDGKLDYKQSPLSSYSLYSDFYWYEIGDVICIGDSKMLYYCFPKCEGDFVAKTRLAAEELYKIVKEKRRR